MKNKNELIIIAKIAKRADEMGLMMFDRFSLIMDLQNTHEQYNLRLDELLKADDQNFAHDIVGIQNNFNRQTLKMENLFLPRYASQ